MIRVVKRRAFKKENDFEQGYFYNMYAAMYSSFLMIENILKRMYMYI